MTHPTVRDAFEKSPYRSIKYSSYFAIYDKFFAPYRGKPITFVEIGVLDGGSLFMWREYFGPDARIIGIDLNPAAKRWEEHGFEIYIGSQSDTQFWDRFTQEIGKIDVALDDGGHTFQQQIVTVEALLPFMADGGLLAVEDTHTSYHAHFGGPNRRSFVEYGKNLVDGINYRSSLLNSQASDRQVWGISFFESFVIFHINRIESGAQVEFLANSGEAMGAQDFRYHDSSIIGRLDQAIEGDGFLARNPLSKKLLSKGRARLIRLINYLEVRKLGRYFRF